MAGADETAGAGGDQGVDPNIDVSCLKLRQLRGYTVNPSAIGQLFTVETCADGIPVPGLASKDFDIVEDGSPLSTEAAAEFQKSKGLRVYVSLVLDMSSSTHAELPQLIEGAKAFVDELLVSRKLTNVMIGIDLFDGGPTVNEWQLPISDAKRLKAKIDGLTDYVAADASSTNLYGGVIDAVTKLQQREVKIMTGNDNGVVTVGYAVLFTDGADTAARVPKATAVSTLAAARFVDPASMQVQATVATYAVPLAGADYTPGSLEALLSGTIDGTSGPNANVLCSDACIYANNRQCDDGGVGSGTLRCALGTDCSDCGARAAVPTSCTDICLYAKNGVCDDGSVGSSTARCKLGSDCTDCAGSTDQGAAGAPGTATGGPETVDGKRFVFQADNAQALKQSFSDLAAAISRQLDGTYLLAYCSPKRTGQHKLSLNVKKTVSANSTGYEFPFSATGFGPGCDTAYFAGVCKAKQCGGFNCGACNDETDICNTKDDTCQSACLSQNACSGQTITNGLGYSQVCDADPNVKSCQGTCVDLLSNAQNCGTCGTRCAPTATCSKGECACATAGTTSCPTGCFNLDTDSSNCGACGNYCPLGTTCTGGVCQCGASLTACTGTCVDLTTSRTNCGKCGSACPLNATCTASKCACTNPALTACDTLCTDMKTDLKNCGACGAACKATELCTAGTCTACADTTLPATSTVSYSGTATAIRARAAYCSSGVDGTALSWTAPTTGAYLVALTGAVGVQADVSTSCTSTFASYCLTAGPSTRLISVAQGASLFFFVRDSTMAASAFNLKIYPTGTLPPP
jgi:hypothetical protein